MYRSNHRPRSSDHRSRRPKPQGGLAVVPPDLAMRLPGDFPQSPTKGLLVQGRMECAPAVGQIEWIALDGGRSLLRRTRMARHRSHSVDFKRQVVAEHHAGEPLHALGRRHDLSRNLIRIWIENDLRPDFPPAFGRIRRLTSGLMRPWFPVSISLQTPAA